MPHYVFLCQDCSKEFTQILHIADLEKGGVLCPHSDGKRVTQKVADVRTLCALLATGGAHARHLRARHRAPCVGDHVRSKGG